MSYRIATALVAGLVSIAPAAVTSAAAQTPAPGAAAAQPAAGTTADASFIRQAAEGGMKEVEAGKLAQARAADSNVKAFAERMVQDHSKANDELMTLAKSKGVTLPPPTSRPATTATDASRPTGTSGSGAAATSGTSGAQAGGALAGLKGAEFDRAYMTEMVQDHEKTVQLFEQESKSGQDAEVKAWAAKQLPALREHLTQARSVRDRLGASK